MGQPQFVTAEKYTIEEWLELERSTGERYEYHFGDVFMMAGGTLAHAEISGNAYYQFREKLKNGNCRPFNSELKIQVNAKGRFVYPDTLVICGKPKESKKVKGSITNPTVVIEVLSESSEAYDRGVKFKYYRSLASVKEYLIVSQTEPAATLYRRHGEGDIFSRIEFEGLATAVELTSIDITLPLADLYDNVDFPPTEEK